MWPWFSCPGGTTEGVADSPTSAAAAAAANTGSGGSGGGSSSAADSKRTEGFRRENARLREANTRLLSRVRALEGEVGHLRRDVHDRERDALRARAAAAAAAAPAAAQCAGVAAVLPALAQLEKTLLAREEGLARSELSDALARGAVQAAAAAAAAATAAADADADGDVEGDCNNVEATSPETEEVLCCDDLGPSPVEEGAAVGGVLRCVASLNKGVPATVVPPLGATEKAYCVVFDVDETQVHFAVETMPEPKAELRFRRGVDLALKKLSRLKAEGLELGLWTAGVPRYAVAVRGLLGMLAGWQESEVFDWTIARDPSWVSNGVRKDLSTLNRDLRRVLLVENSRKVVVQKENTLIVTNFYSTAKGAVRDHTLNTVASLVEEMVRSDPPVAVPDFLRQKATDGALHCQNGFYHVPTSRTR